MWESVFFFSACVSFNVCHDKSESINKRGFAWSKIRGSFIAFRCLCWYHYRTELLFSRCIGNSKHLRRLKTARPSSIRGSTHSRRSTPKRRKLSTTTWNAKSSKPTWVRLFVCLFVCKTPVFCSTNLFITFLSHVVNEFYSRHKSLWNRGRKDCCSSMNEVVHYSIEKERKEA